jgi:adenylate cyclase
LDQLRWLMRLLLKTFFSKRVLVAAVACLVLAFMTGMRSVDPEFLKSLRELTFDYYQRMKPRDFQPAPVRIVDIDEASIAEIGQWPWPRTKLAEMVQILTDIGAAAIVFDMVFAEPDRTSPAQLLGKFPDGTSDEVLTEVSNLPDNDKVFGSAIAQGPVVLGFAITQGTMAKAPQVKSGFAFAGEDPTSFLDRFTNANSNLDTLQTPASGIGSISTSFGNRQGVVRWVPLVFSDGTQLYPNLTAEALRVAQGAQGYIVKATGASGEADLGNSAITDIKIGSFAVPTTRSGELWVYYDHERSDRYVSALQVYDPGELANLSHLMEGQIVLIGTSAPGLEDLRTSALGEQVPGVSIHAQALEQIIHGQFLSRPDWANGLETILTFAVGAIVILALPAIGSIGTAILGAVIVSGLVGGSVYLFWEKGLLIDPVYPSVVSILVFTASTALLYFLTEREKRFVRQAFSQYLSPELVTQLEETPEQLALGGEIRPMTILFMDIRGFTPISEQLTPEELVSFLNTLLSPLSDAIQAEGGTIDKYIGDSIMAFWNAPLSIPEHAEKACRAGLAMLDVVEELNNNDAFGFKARSLKTQTVKIGIGLNTGEVCVGNMGSARRFNYSVIGDAVNIASRIESSCKAVGAELLVSEDTRVQATGLAYLEAGEIPLKGKSEPVKLFAILGDETLKVSEKFQQLEEAHGRLIQAIKDQDCAAARAELVLLKPLAPTLQDFYGRFESFIGELDDEIEESGAAH